MKKQDKYRYDKRTGSNLRYQIPLSPRERNISSLHALSPSPLHKKAGISLTYFSDFTHKTRKIKKGKRFVLYTIQLFQHGERSCIRNSYTSAGNGIKHAKIQQMLYFAVKTLSFKRNDMRGFLRNCHTSAGGGWVS